MHVSVVDCRLRKKSIVELFSAVVLLLPEIFCVLGCRLWIAPPNERPLPEKYEDIYGGPLTIGDRGGIHVEGTQEHIVLEAE